jgi:hypothetical protein
MADDRLPRDMEIYAPHERLPAERAAPDPRLPYPVPELPPDFPMTGIFQLLRFRQSTRLSSRYNAALDALHGAYAAANRVQEAKLALQRSTNRLRNAQTILDSDTDDLNEQRFRAAARKTLAELDAYRATAALNEFRSRGVSGTNAANGFAEDAAKLIKGLLDDKT